MTRERVNRFLVVGLGNPGEAYRRNRHNVGWMTLDVLAREMMPDAAFARGAGLAGEILDGRWAGRRLILLKPLTFMNLSGQAVARGARLFEIDPAGMLVIYDDADLPLGMIRLRERGSSGGHRGMDSIIECLGTEEIPRIRIGIAGGETAPAGRRDLVDYVLEDFSEDETALLDEVLATCLRAVKEIVRGGMHRAMSRYNRKKPASEAAAGSPEPDRSPGAPGS